MTPSTGKSGTDSLFKKSESLILQYEYYPVEFGWTWGGEYPSSNCFSVLWMLFLAPTEGMLAKVAFRANGWMAGLLFQSHFSQDKHKSQSENKTCKINLMPVVLHWKNVKYYIMFLIFNSFFKLNCFFLYFSCNIGIMIIEGVLSAYQCSLSHHLFTWCEPEQILTTLTYITLPHVEVKWVYNVLRLSSFIWTT